MSDLIVPFLDIGKEGELQGQIKSVVRDLDIMLRITMDQKDIFEKYEKAVAHMAQSFSPIDMDPMHAETKSNIDVLEDMRKSAGDISASVSARISFQLLES